jgi:hypothetical protein
MFIMNGIITIMKRVDTYINIMLLCIIQPVSQFYYFGAIMASGCTEAKKGNAYNCGAEYRYVFHGVFFKINV